MTALWEREDFRRAAGDAWRPGGPALTRRGLELCESLCGLEPGALVVDMGCGAGATLALLAGSGYRPLGLDSKMVSRAGAASPAAAVARADVARLPLADGCAGAVVCECVLSLMEDPEAVLCGFHRVLRPGGALLCSDLTLREGAGHAAGRTGRGSSCLAGARPVAEWGALLTRAGFQVLRHESHDRALVELAARMVWYGAAAPPGSAFPFSGRRACPGAGARAYGYGLWIAQKETL